MKKNETLDPELREQLLECYEQMMWLARQRFVTPSMARAWYTHIAGGRFCRRIRMFTGKVSVLAADDPTATLRLEHYGRIQTSLTQLVKRHLKLRKPRPDEFIDLLVQRERVHVVTFAENYAALKASGSYRKAGIALRDWDTLPPDTRKILWTRMLRGRVANAAQFSPTLKRARSS